MVFSEQLSKLRKEANMTQEDLAEKLDVSRQAISRWESGTAMPDANNILQLSKLFGVTTEQSLRCFSQGPIKSRTRVLPH